MVLTIVHIALILPPKIVLIARFMAIPVSVATIDVSPAASSFAFVAGSMY